MERRKEEAMRSVQEVEKEIAIIEKANVAASKLKRSCEDLLNELHDELEKAQKNEKEEST